MSRPTCRTTGIYVDQCAHCPMDAGTDAPAVVVTALPEPAPAPRRKVMREARQDGLVLTEALRTRLIGRGRSEWFASCGKWVHCAVCRRDMQEGDPVRFLYGRTAKDMAYLGWCCHNLDRDTIKDALRRGGWDSTEAPGAPAEPETPPTPTTKPRRGGGMLGV